MHGSIRVLHVDDEPDFADLVSTYLEREDDRFDVLTSTDPDDALERIDVEAVDCIVSDYDMPGRNGIEFLEAVRADHPDLPFILYTGKGSEEVASEAISAGVSDYLQKARGTSQYEVLANRIVNYVERVSAQAELADREERLNLFFEQSPLGVVRWDDEFNFARLNETAADTLGYTAAELEGEPWDVVIPEEDREEIGEVVVADLLADEGGYHSINENVRKDGERIVCEWHNWVVTDDDEDVVAVFSQFQDITERRQRRRERERYRAITQAATNTIITIDETNVIRTANPAVEETFGYAPAEIVGEDLTVLMPDGVADRHRAAFERYLETGEKTLDWNYVEFPGEHRDGPEMSLSLSIGEVEFEGEQYFVGIIRDITERKEHEQELERVRKRFKAIFEASHDAIFVLDPDDERIVDANPRAEELLGYAHEELCDSVTLADICADDGGRYRALLDDLRTANVATRGRYRLVTKSGDPMDCEVSISSTEFGDDRYAIAAVRELQAAE